jgi:hypothetical protein
MSAALICPADLLRSEGDDGSDRRLHERVWKRACELVDGFPAGAVRRQDSAYFCGDESIDGRLDGRFEEAAREVKAADERGEPLFAGQALRVA